MLAAAPVALCFLTGCGDFWEAPNTSSTTGFTLAANPTSVTVAPGATSSAVTLTVTPGSSFTGTVTLSCSVTSAPTGATSSEYPTCDFSSSSLTFSSTTAQQPTFTATAPAASITGPYDINVTGVSGSTAETTSFCVEVGTGTCTAASTSSGNFYVLTKVGIYGYSISSSKLTALTGSPTSLPATAGAPQAMAYDPKGPFLYVATANGILLYDVGSGGALTLVSAGTIPDNYSFALQVDSSGQWLLDASDTAGQPTLYAWPISTTTGESLVGSLTSVPARLLKAGGNVTYGGLAISPDNKLVSVAVGSETDTFVFTVGTDFTGATNPLSSTHDYRTATGTAISVAFDPNTSFLYIGETGYFTSSATDSGALRIIPIASDVLGTEPSTSTTYPYPSGGDGPHAILADSNGYVYVANTAGISSNGNITSFLLVAATPALTLQSTSAAAGVDPLAMALDSSGDFVFVANNLGSVPLDAYTFDASTTGKLDPFTISGTVGASPVAIVAVPK
jgi:6-phosphogluconolactonase (cycloisomerase 2 family)